MKVKELIEQLKGFDQDKNIWIGYDRYAESEPYFEQADEDDAECFKEVKEGDYIMNVY